MIIDKRDWSLVEHQYPFKGFGVRTVNPINRFPARQVGLKQREIIVSNSIVFEFLALQFMIDCAESL